MVFKVALLVLGLFAMTILISSKGAARELGETSTISRMAEVVKEQNDVGDVKSGKKPCIRGSGGKDCFGLIPGMPGMPGIPGGMPGMPGTGVGMMPGIPWPGTGMTPGMPGIPAPGMPGAPAPGMPGGGMSWPGTGMTAGMPGGGYGGGPSGPGAKGYLGTHN